MFPPRQFAFPQSNGTGESRGPTFCQPAPQDNVEDDQQIQTYKKKAHKERQNNTQIIKKNTNSKQKYTSNTDLLPTIFLGAYMICNRQEKFYHLGHLEIEVKLFLWTI